jgi:hypothetical protein
MLKFRLTFFLPVWLTLMAQAEAATLWGIYWISNVSPCGNTIHAGLAGPLLSHFYPLCKIKDVSVSICPQPKIYPSYPWDNDASITIVGYEIALMLSSPTSQGVMEVGSGHGGDGADILAVTAGVGTNSKAAFFPAATGVPQGAVSYSPGYQHFDIYAVCDGGPSQSMQALVNIYYTSP